MEPSPIIPHVGREAIVDGWRYLLCSDGLSAVVDMDAIEAQLANDGASTARRLVESALAGGGPDKGQAAAISRCYTPLVERFALPPVNWPVVPDKLADAVRREEIAAELRESAAKVVITLGDQPLEWFGTAFGSERSLGAYGKDPKTYGVLHDVEIEGRVLKLLPLVHPRQAAGLGARGRFWRPLHETWVRQMARVVHTLL